MGRGNDARVVEVGIHRCLLTDGRRGIPLVIVGDNVDVRAVLAAQDNG